MKKYTRYILFLVGFSILAWMVWRADPVVLWHHLLALGWVYLALVAVVGVVYILNAVSWATIIGAWPMQKKLGPATILQCTISGYAINCVTPFGLLGGEPYRILRLKPYIGIEAATSSVTLYAMMHMCSHFIFWLLACVVALFIIPDISPALAWTLIFIVVSSLVLVYLFSLGYRRGLMQFASSNMSHWPFIGKRVAVWRASHLDRLKHVDEGIASLLHDHPGRFWSSLLIEFFSRIVGCLEYWLILWQLGFGDTATFAAAYVIVAFSSLFANLLFFSPMQMGTREGGILLSLQALSIYGAGLPVAISISFATRLREFLWIGIGLILTLFGGKVEKK